MPQPLEREIEETLAELGFELVELERAGPRTRPLLRLRIDRLEGDLEGGVSLDDCTRASRALEISLDQRKDLSERYVLEVSSPGVERPLVRSRDFERFAGRRIAVHGRTPLHGGAKRVEGELLGLAGAGDDQQIRLRTEAGEEIAMPRAQVTKAHLVFEWGGGKKVERR